MSDMQRIPVVICRGGTSKGVFVQGKHLPQDPAIKQKVLLALLGSPDKRQIDGLGGADPLTSKLVIIDPPSRPDAHVDYTFGQVDIYSPHIDYSAVCGNLSAAVAPFAIDEGLVEAVEPRTTVRIHNTNIKRIIEATVPVVAGQVVVAGDFAIDGVPGTGARIDLNWADTVGANTRSLLPTGQPVDELQLPQGINIKCSLVDVGNPGVFVLAQDVGMDGTETPEQFDGNPAMIGLCEDIVEAASRLIGVPAYLSLVAPSKSYINHVTEQEVSSRQVDLLVRMFFMGKMHKAYAASQTTCCGAAALIPDTLVNRVASQRSRESRRVLLGHPAGVAEVALQTEREAGQMAFTKISVGRTARRLLEGYAFIKNEVFN